MYADPQNNYMQWAMGLESGGDPNAKNPRSSAKGLFQFTDGTWGGLANKYPDLALTDPYDQDQQKRAMERFTADNAKVLQSNGFQTDNNTLYAAHRFGAGGALNLLRSDPNSPIEGVVSPKVLQANPDLAGKTVGQVLQRSNPTYGARPPQVSAATPAPDTPPGLGMFGPTGAMMSGASAPAPGGDGEDRVAKGLMMLGSSLKSASNPEGAAVLAKMAEKVGGEDGKWTTHYDATTGLGYKTNAKGQVQFFKGPSVPQKKGNEAYDAAMGKHWAEQNQAMSQSSAEAQEKIGKLDLMKQLSADPRVYQGFLGEHGPTIKKFAQSLGMNVEGVSESELFQKLSNEMTLGLKQSGGKNLMPGNFSDQDRKFLERMSTGLDTSREGNQLAIEIHHRAAKRAIDIDRLREDYVAQNGRLDDGFNKVKAQYLAQNSAFSDIAERAKPAQAQPAQPSQTNRPPLGSIFK